MFRALGTTTLRKDHLFVSHWTKRKQHLRVHWAWKIIAGQSMGGITIWSHSQRWLTASSISNYKRNLLERFRHDSYQISFSSKCENAVILLAVERSAQVQTLSYDVPDIFFGVTSFHPVRHKTSWPSRPFLEMQPQIALILIFSINGKKLHQRVHLSIPKFTCWYQKERSPSQLGASMVRSGWQLLVGKVSRVDEKDHSLRSFCLSTSSSAVSHDTAGAMPLPTSTVSPPPKDAQGCEQCSHVS